MLGAVGFHHHTADTLEVKTPDGPGMQQEAKPSGCLLTNSTGGDGTGLKRWPNAKVNGGALMRRLHGTQFYCYYTFQSSSLQLKPLKTVLVSIHHSLNGPPSHD